LSTLSAAESQSVHLNRSIAASPELVFRAWVDPALLQRWLSPIAEADARAGGRFRLEVSKPEGVHVVTGEYLEFMPGQRLAMTWVYEGPMIPAGKMESLLTVDFREDGPDTEVSLHHERLTDPVYFETIRNGAWAKALDQMQTLLADPSH
jgi:uncharacterized protein YndB with AHSA1/START domain